MKLDTNGTHPDTLQPLIDERLVDYIAMDIKDDFAGMDWLTQTTGKQEKIQQSIQIVMKNSATHGIDYEFRTTVSKPYHTPEKVKAIASYIADTASNVSKELQTIDTTLEIKPPKYAIQNFYPTDNMIDQTFQGGKFTRVEMQQMQEIANKYVATEIRGIINN